MRSERYIALVLFLLSFLYLCLFRRFTAMEPDEGIILQGAQRILAGQVPYRDFFSFYTPGSYYALALLFRIFGCSMLVARTALALVGAILSLITYVLTRRVCSRAVAITITVLATSTTIPFRFLVLHNWDSTLWACLSVYSAVLLLERPDWKRAFALGSCASLTVLFEQSKGAGLCLGLTSGFLALFFLRKPAPVLSRRQISWVFLGFAWPFLITFAYFASQHSISEMVADWLWPLAHYSQANRVPYGYQNWSDESRHLLFGTGSLAARVIKLWAISPSFWIPALPIVLALLVIYWIYQARRKRIDDDRTAYFLIVGVGSLGLFLSAIAARADIIHFMYLQPFNCLVLAWLIEGADTRGRAMKTAKPLLLAYVVIALGLFGLAPLLAALSPSHPLATRRGYVMTREKDTVIEYVDQRVSSGDTIFIYPYLPLYYYLTGTFSPTRYDYFQPGMHTREQAEEIVHQLAVRQVNVVLFEITFPEKIAQSWPDTPLPALANDPVGDYIVRNYRSCATLTSPMSWHFVFMVRKDLSCP